jgi:hypothetical protein
MGEDQRGTFQSPTVILWRRIREQRRREKRGKEYRGGEGGGSGEGKGGGREEEKIFQST